MPSKQAPDKSKYWTFEGYFDSWPTLLEDVDGLHIPYAGIIHNRDVKEDGSGEFKKEHAHIILEFEGPTTSTKVRAILAAYPVPNGVVLAVNSFVGMCRYLLHLDNPEKAQYLPDEIFTGSGGWVELEKPVTSEDRHRIRNEVLAFVLDNNIYEYADLVEVAHSSYPEWVDDVDGSTVFWTRYLASKRGRDGVAYNSESR